MCDLSNYETSAAPHSELIVSVHGLDCANTAKFCLGYDPAHTREAVVRISWNSGLSDRNDGDLLHSDFLTAKMLHKIPDMIMLSQATMTPATCGRLIGSNSLHAQASNDIDSHWVFLSYSYKIDRTSYELRRLIVPRDCSITFPAGIFTSRLRRNLIVISIILNFTALAYIAYTLCMLQMLGATSKPFGIVGSAISIVPWL